MMIRPGRQRGAHGGFTLVELLVGIIVVGILLSLLLVALRGARNAGRAGAARRTVAALKIGVVAFKDRYGFLPPLIKDQKTGSGGGAIATFTDPASGQSERKFNIYDVTKDLDLKALRAEGDQPSDQDTRYSEVALPYYLAGACSVRVWANPNAGPIDGVPGPGFMPPNPDGTFKLTAALKLPDATAPKSHAGRAEPLVEVGKRTLQISSDLTTDPLIGEPTLVQFRDASSRVYRYYRWMPDEKLKTASASGVVSDSAYEDYYNIPIAVADWSAWKDNPQLRDARYAIVLPGEDGLYGDEAVADIAAKLGVAVPAGADAIKALRSKARADNIVEFGS